jgi:hypothetical protein
MQDRRLDTLYERLLDFTLPFVGIALGLIAVRNLITRGALANFRQDLVLFILGVALFAGFAPRLLLRLWSVRRPPS